MQAPDSSRVAQNVRRYYERNTRLFQSLGRQKKVGSIHRAVWAAGVSDFNAALNYTNDLVLTELGELISRDSLGHMQALDLGCGVGGSLFYLADHLGRLFFGLGVTLSPRQARLAHRSTQRLGLQNQCVFLEADFLGLPFSGHFDAAYAIESLAHAAHPARFFEQAAGVLRTGGRLLVCDDFLAAGISAADLPSQQRFWLYAFQRGWQSPSLASHQEAVRLAEDQGLVLLSERNLTSYLRFSLIPAWMAASLVRAWLRLDPVHPYWGSLLGGLALQECLKRGITTYRFLVFEKQISSPRDRS